MGYSLNPDIEPRLLFFFRRNDLCNNYHARYLKSFKNLIFYFDMDVPGPKDFEAAKNYNVESVPTLILLDEQGYEELRWCGGLGPDPNLLNIEMGMSEAWWKDDDKQPK